MSAGVGYIALARLSAGGGTVVRWGGYIALARLSAEAEPLSAGVAYIALARLLPVAEPLSAGGLSLLAFGNTVVRFFSRVHVGLRAEKV